MKEYNNFITDKKVVDENNSFLEKKLKVFILVTLRMIIV
jgi:hypothetical protein